MEEISIDQLILENRYLRFDTDIDKLCESISQVGLIHPLIVNKDNKLLSGGRRLSALKKLGFNKVPIVRVDKGELIEELISIDENLIRLELKNTDLEIQLLRAKELYESLYPDSVEENRPRELTTEQVEALPLKFETQTAKKTGLSENSISMAIKRAEKSAPTVVKLRKEGLISTAQANELIKLDRDDQEKILPVVVDRPVSEIKDLIKNVKQMGLTQAIEIDSQTDNHSKRDFVELNKLAKKLNKQINKILSEDVEYQGPGHEKVYDSVIQVFQGMKQLLEQRRPDILVEFVNNQNINNNSEHSMNQ
ncbi:MAG: ParB N-terminal domain-containing protein [Halobacteriovoraceae bacterium]|nr:ParB N-terminal domain-containing protein [Halobacteriovoraceae bacterium]